MKNMKKYVVKTAAAFRKIRTEPPDGERNAFNF